MNYPMFAAARAPHVPKYEHIGEKKRMCWSELPQGIKQWTLIFEVSIGAVSSLTAQGSSYRREVRTLDLDI